MCLLTVQNFGSAMADVVVDAMIAEAVRFERYVHNLRSFCYFVQRTLSVCISVRRYFDSYMCPQSGPRLLETSSQCLGWQWLWAAYAGACQEDMH